MNFLAPWASWFLAGLPLICLLYLLKVRRTRLPVSTLFLWQKQILDHRRRALFQRLRNPLSLLLQLLIFALLVCALGRPVLHTPAASGQATIVVLDSRPRMQALEPDGKTRFQHAIQTAQALVLESNEARPFALLLSGPKPQILCPFSAHTAPLSAALLNASPCDASISLDATLQLARELRASRPNGARILVLTDSLPQPGPVPSTADPHTDFLSFGSPRDNLAITRFASRPLPNSPETCEVLLEAANFTKDTASFNVEVSLDDKLLDVKTFQLAPNTRKALFFPVLAPPSKNARGWLVARISPSLSPDVLPLDDIAYSVLRPQPKLRTLLVTKGNWFLEKLLEADQKLSYELLSPEDFQPAMAAQFDAVILDDLGPLPIPLASPPGNFLFLNQTPWGTLGNDLPPPILPEADSAHPIMRLVDFTPVSVFKAREVPLPASPSNWTFAIPLLSGDRPLILAGETRSNSGSKRSVAFGFPLSHTDLPLRIAFPLLISNTVQWLAGSSNDLPSQITAGTSLPLPKEHSASPWPQLPRPQALVPPPVVPTPLFQPLLSGFYEITTPTHSDWVAVNTFSEQESDLRSAAPAQINAPALSQATRASLVALPFLGWAPWQILTAAALLLSLAEWWLFHRRHLE
jgi:Ca-activated chloride channel family protein